MQFRNDPSRPLVYMSYWVAMNWGGGSPLAFHIINTLVHSLNAALVVLLAFQLSSSLPAAATAGALFATSPLLVGTASYAFGLSDLMGTLFVLAGLVCMTGRCRLFWAGAGCFILALLSKQSSVVFPALVVAIDYFTRRPANRQRYTEYGILFAIALIYLALRWLYFGGIGDLEGTNQLLPVSEYAPTQSISIFKYLGHIFLPVSMSIDHRPLPTDFPQWIYGLAWLAIAVLTIFAIRVRNWLGLGWVFFLICLLPTSSIFPTVDLYVERRGYLAASAIFVCISILFWKYGRQKFKLAASLISVLIIAQTARAVQRIGIYGDPEGLWQESLALDEDNPRALINLAVYYSAVEKWEESRELLERLLIQQPTNGSIYTKLAYIYHQKSYAKNDPQKAMELYERGLEVLPDNIFAIYNFATLKFEMGRYAEAESLYLRTLELAPQMTRSLIAAAQSAIAQKKYETAAEYLSRALAINPNLEDAKSLLQQLRQ